MVRINVRLENRYKRKDGRSTLKIAVHFNGKTHYVNTNLYINAADWDSARQTIKGAQNRSLNTLLQKKKSDMETRLLMLQEKGVLRTMTDKQIMDTLEGKSDADMPHYFKSIADKFLATKTNSRTKELYEATVKKLQAFCDYDNITFEEMNVSWLRSFDAYLAETEKSANSRSIHLRNVRTIFNAALDDELISVYPFRRYKIESEETEKRSISIEDMRRLYHCRVPAYQQKYKDCFFLIFFLIGINMVDLSKLTEDNFVGGRIKYIRSKTHKRYNLLVEQETGEILRLYAGKTHLLRWFDNVKDYRSFAMRVNRNLQRIARENNLPPITTYVARHSWATYASELDIPKDVISHALGHHVNVTDTYIRFDLSKVDAANRRVMDYLLEK